MTGATAVQKAIGSGGINQWKRQEFLSLYPNRTKHICKSPSDPKWKTLQVPLFTGMVDAAISGQCNTFYGAFWGQETRFAVLDIDSRNSRYYNRESLAKLLAAISAVGLRVNLYRSSESRGWHLYVPFDGWEQSRDVERTLKQWLKAMGYEIRGGQLEIFPGGNALRLPLQPGFAWLDQNGNVIRTREEVSIDEALASFLTDLKTDPRNWTEAKNLIESQIIEIDRAIVQDVQAHEERLDMEGFEHVLCRGKIQETWEKGRKWWRDGLQENGERHNAVLAVGHYLWYGDEERSIAALPGTQNADYRAHLIEAWLRKNHNGKCRHINQGSWDIVREQIHRASLWRRDKETWQREHYPLTGRLLKRLVALYSTTKRIWSIEQFEKANQDRRLEARARIAEAIVSLEDEGKQISVAEVARRAKADWRTVKKNWDLMAVVLTSDTLETNIDLLACSGGVINPGGAGSVSAEVEDANQDVTPSLYFTIMETAKDITEIEKQASGRALGLNIKPNGNLSSLVAVSAFSIGKTLFILPYGAKRRPQQNTLGSDSVPLRRLLCEQGMLKPRCIAPLPLRTPPFLNLLCTSSEPRKPEEQCHTDSQVRGYNICRGAP